MKIHQRDASIHTAKSSLHAVRRRAFAMLVLGSTWLATTFAVGQDYDSDRLTEEGFVAAEIPTDEIAGGPLLIAAYVVLWALVFAYGFNLVRKQSSIRDDLVALRLKSQDIEDRLDELEGNA